VEVVVDGDVELVDVPPVIVTGTVTSFFAIGLSLVKMATVTF
jgi:hypothetical protein